MSSLNKVMLIGRLGKDPELRTTQAQQPVANFSLATTEKFNGNEKTEWHNIVVWGKIAEICKTYLKKGSLVYLEGRIASRAWEKNGEKRVSTEIVAFTVQFLSPAGSKPQDQASSVANAESGPQAGSGWTSQPAEPPFDFNEVPF